MTGWQRSFEKGEYKKNRLKDWAAEHPKTFVAACVGLGLLLLSVFSMD